MRILVVDDSSDMRRLVAEAMDGERSPDGEVLGAADGMQALATVARHGPSIDLILCDVSVPSADGLALLVALRSSPEYRHIPFVVVADDVLGESVARALREGAAGVLGKPFRPEAIVDLVRRRRSRGKGATSSLFETDAVVAMMQTMSRTVEPGAPARPQ